MPQFSFIKPRRTSSILLPTMYEKHGVGEDDTNKELDESIEVEVGPITTTACASSSSYASHGDIIPSLMTSSSEARSEIDATETVVAGDERYDDDVVACVVEAPEDAIQGVVEVQEKQEECPTVEGINDDCVTEAEVDSSTEIQGEKYVNATEEGLKDEGETDDYIGDVSLYRNANEDCLRQANKELMDTVKELMNTVQYLRTMNGHNAQQTYDSTTVDRMPPLDDIVTAKQVINVEMTSMIKSLEEKLAENASLKEQVHNQKDNYARLEAENRTLIASNKENTRVIAGHGIDVAAKKCIIDEMTAVIQQKNISLKEKTAEIADLMEQIQHSKAKNEELEAEVQHFAASDKSAQQFKSFLITEEVETLVASNKMIVQKMAILEEDLAAKKSMIAEMIKDIDNKSSSLEEKSVEIAGLSQRLQIITTENVHLRTEIKASITSNKANVDQMTVLQDELATKKITIDALSEDIKNLKSTCMKMASENAALDEQLELSNAEHDLLKTTAQDFESKNTKIVSEVENLTSSMQEMVERNEALRLQVEELSGDNDTLAKINKTEKETIAELQIRIKEVSSTNDSLSKINKIIEEKKDELMNFVGSMTKSFKVERSEYEKEIQEMKKINSASEEKIIELLDAVERTTKMLNEERGIYEREIETVEKALETKKEEIADIAVLLRAKNTENVDLAEQLQLLKAEYDGIDAEVQTLAARTKENVEQMLVLEDDVTAKKSRIDAMGADIKLLNSTCEQMNTENETLVKQLDIFTVESNRLKTTVHELESKNINYATEVEKLTSILSEANSSNGALQLRIQEISSVNDTLSQISKKSKKTITELQVAVQTMTKSLNDEKSSHDKQVEEMKHVMENLVRMSEESLGDATAKISEQKKTIDDLAKSLDEAIVEIRNKDTTLAEKTTEIQMYVDLAEQLKMSDCGIGMGNFWRSK